MAARRAAKPGGRARARPRRQQQIQQLAAAAPRLGRAASARQAAEFPRHPPSQSGRQPIPLFSFLVVYPYHNFRCCTAPACCVSVPSALQSNLHLLALPGAINLSQAPPARPESLNGGAVKTAIRHKNSSAETTVRSIVQQQRTHRGSDGAPSSQPLRRCRWDPSNTSGCPAPPPAHPAPPAPPRSAPLPPLRLAARPGLPARCALPPHSLG